MKSRRIRSGSRRNNRKKSRRNKKRTIRRLNKRGGEENCAICLEELNNGNENIRLNCNHKYHKNCMRNVCQNRNVICKCPLCRRGLNEEDMNELGLNEQGLGSVDSTFPPNLETIEEFKDYINNKLRRSRIEASRALSNELYEFVNTQSVPLLLLNGSIMEFILERIGGEEKYQLNRIIENVPSNRSNKKYYKYIPYEAEGYEYIVDELVEL